MSSAGQALQNKLVSCHVSRTGAQLWDWQAQSCSSDQAGSPWIAAAGVAGAAAHRQHTVVAEETHWSVDSKVTGRAVCR